MHLKDYSDFISFVTVFATIGQFLSGILVCKQFIVNKTTADSSPFPFISLFFSCATWFQYGLMKPDDKILLVNFVGITLSMAYIFVFYAVTIKKGAVFRQFALAVILQLLIVGYVINESDQQLLILRLGLLGCSMTLIFVAAPLTQLYHVFVMKSTDSLPFPMILTTCIVSTLWYLYGIMVEDPFITVQNFICVLLSAFQLCLFKIYPQSKSRSEMNILPK